MANELVEIIHCRHCGQDKPADSRDKHLCVDCAKAENSRYTYLRQHQGDWMAEAAEQGIDPWEKQPNESQWEYTVWTAYRDSYPGKKPSYGDVAQQLGTTYNVVRKVAQRWSFPARLQAWITECDRITLAQRRSEILDMNKAHIDMAAKLRNKLATAIDLLEPATLTPKDINALFKTAAELETRARVDSVAQDEMLREIQHGVDNPELKKSPTKKDDLAEVVQILLQAGALGSVTQIGVKETTTHTREVVARDDSGAMATLIEG